MTAWPLPDSPRADVRLAVVDAVGVASVSIIIPVRTPSEAFDRCLAAVQQLDPAPDEVVVVVDGGDVATAAQAQASVARVVAVPEASGPSVARNRGAAVATGDLLFFVDADVVLPTSAVGRVRAWFAGHPHCSALIGSYDDSPSEPNFSSQLKNLANHWYHQHAHEQASTFWAACGVIRRPAFERVAGFDERYGRPSVEDIDLGYRLRDNGERIAVDKGLQVTHLKRWTLTSLVRTDVVRRALPWSALILRRGRADDDLNVSIRDRLAAGLALVGLLAAGAALWMPVTVLGAVVCALTQLVLDRSLLRFFARRRGVVFAVRAAPMLLAYHLYSALSFVCATVRHLARRHRAAAAGWEGGWSPHADERRLSDVGG